MSVAPQADAAVGAVLNGEWRLLRLVGEGGLAAVYEAENLQGKGRRAIKLLHGHFQSQRSIVERFYAEAKACFSLRHPHIANVEAYAYAEDGSPYIVMELLKGFSLEEILRKRVPMPVDQAAPVMYGVLQGVGAAHAAGIIHRDIKPANLFMVPQSNGNYAPKVLDFGIAKVLDVAGGMGTKTRTGAVLGTPGYMAPEQIKDAKSVDPRTDLWAVGVVFYEMLCCHHPYGNADQFARMVAVLRDKPKPISQIDPELIQWDAFFERALQRDPKDRFRNTDEMAKALRDIAQGTTAHFIPNGVQTVAMPVVPDLAYRPPTPAPHNSNAQPPSPVTQVGAVPMTNHAARNTGNQLAGAPGASTPPPANSAVPAVSGAYSSPAIPGAAMPGAAMPGAAMPGPRAGSRPASGTQVSGSTRGGQLQGYGRPPPKVEIIEAAPDEGPSMIWWGVMLLGIACLTAGLLIGYMIGAS